MIDVLYTAYWGLCYTGKPIVIEPPQGETIKNARRGAEAICIVDLLGSPKVMVEIPLGHRPIFYRVMEVTPGNGQAQVEATVFGHAASEQLRPDAIRINATLFLWTGSEAVNMPQHLYREGAVLNLLTG